MRFTKRSIMTILKLTETSRIGKVVNFEHVGTSAYEDGRSKFSVISVLSYQRANDRTGDLGIMVSGNRPCLI